MPTPWSKKVRKSKSISVFNNAGAWKAAVEKGIKTFNSLSFPVTFTLAEDEKTANIVIKLSTGPDSYDFKSSFYGDVKIKTGPKFKPEFPHGDTRGVVDPDRNEVVFAVTFLPGKIKEPPDGVKEVVVVHELIHGCGVDGGIGGGKQDAGQDHDSEGIMYDIMIPDGNGLIEGTKPKGVKAMPPIRIGAKTRKNIMSIWGD